MKHYAHLVLIPESNMGNEKLHTILLYLYVSNHTIYIMPQISPTLMKRLSAKMAEVICVIVNY